MSCRELRIHITALADDRLESTRVSEVEEHLAACPSCAQFYRNQRELTTWLLSENLQLEPPPAIWSAVQTRIQGGVEPRWSFDVAGILHCLRSTGLDYALAGLILVGFLSVGLFDLGRRSPNNQQFLAELDSYYLEASGNPFMSRVRDKNPFFEFDHKEGNPFESLE